MKTIEMRPGTDHMCLLAMLSSVYVNEMKPDLFCPQVVISPDLILLISIHNDYKDSVTSSEYVVRSNLAREPRFLPHSASEHLRVCPKWTLTLLTQM